MAAVAAGVFTLGSASAVAADINNPDIESIGDSMTVTGDNNYVFYKYNRSNSSFSVTGEGSTIGGIFTTGLNLGDSILTLASGSNVYADVSAIAPNAAIDLTGASGGNLAINTGSEGAVTFDHLDRFVVAGTGGIHAGSVNVTLECHSLTNSRGLVQTIQTTAGNFKMTATGSVGMSVESLGAGSINITMKGDDATLLGAVTGLGAADTLVAEDGGSFLGAISLGAGADTLTLTGDAYVASAVDMGDDADTISLGDTASITGAVTMGAGADVFATQTGAGVTIASIDMGADNDTVGVEVGSTLSLISTGSGLNLGAGVDTLAVSGVLEGNVDGGADADNIIFNWNGGESSLASIAGTIANVESIEVRNGTGTISDCDFAATIAGWAGDALVVQNGATLVIDSTTNVNLNTGILDMSASGNLRLDGSVDYALDVQNSGGVPYTGTIEILSDGGGGVHALSSTALFDGTLIIDNGSTNNLAVANITGRNNQIKVLNGSTLTMGGVYSNAGAITLDGTIDGGGNAFTNAAAGTINVQGASSLITNVASFTNNGDISVNVSDESRSTFTVVANAGGNIDLANRALGVNISGDTLGSIKVFQFTVSGGGALQNVVDPSLNDNSFTVMYTGAWDGSGGYSVTGELDTANIMNAADKSTATAGLSDAFNDVLTTDHNSQLRDIVVGLSTEQNVVQAFNDLDSKACSSSTLQTGLSSVNQSNVAMRSQFTTFRLGAISAAVSSVGATGAEAVDSLATAAELQAAYDAIENGNEVAEEREEEINDIGFALDPNSSLDQYNRWGGFFKVYGGFGDQGNDGDTLGYGYGNVGVVAGLDYALTDEVRAGMMLGYSFSRASINQGMGHGNDNLIRIGSYLSYEWDDLFVDLAPSVGMHLFDTRRNVNFLGTSAIGERTGVDINAMGTVGYTFKIKDTMQITPSYSLGYTGLYDPGYTESGLGYGLDMVVGSQWSNSLIQNVDVKFGKFFDWDYFDFLPEIWAGWEHEYLGSGGDVTNAFVGAPSKSWNTNVARIAADRVTFGGGMTAIIDEDVSVYGRYDHKIWDKGYDVSFTLGVKVTF